MACMVFELACGEFLFDPHSGSNYTRDEGILYNYTRDEGILYNYTRGEGILYNYTRDEGILYNYTLEAILATA